MKKDPELDKLAKELAGRVGTRRRNLHLLAWRLTVWSTYAAKRTLDIVVVLLMMVLLSPLLAATYLAIRLTSPGPALFTQIRVGRDGRHFGFYKFRSMYIDAEKRKAELLGENESKDGVIFKMKNDPRITPVGRFIRKFSIDELPQLWNVLKGDMTLVGPRPPVPSEVAQYTLDDRKRLNVIPGLTCLWQVSGRSDISFRDQVRLDKEYIQTSGFWNDMKILARTVPAILTGRGAY